METAQVTHVANANRPVDTDEGQSPVRSLYSLKLFEWSGVQVVLKKIKYRFKNMWIKQNFSRFQRSASKDLNTTVLTVNNTMNFSIMGEKP